MGEASREELFDAFRSSVRDKFAADVEAERAIAEALRRDLIPMVRGEIGRLRAGGHCRRVWLFGSYAWGEPTEASDLDLLVETESDPLFIAAQIGRATRRMVHVVVLREAPASLVERARSGGIAL